MGREDLVLLPLVDMGLISLATSASRCRAAPCARG
jgi:hypothetical protein